jgi:hypothetical protein
VGAIPPFIGRADQFVRWTVVAAPWAGGSGLCAALIAPIAWPGGAFGALIRKWIDLRHDELAEDWELAKQLKELKPKVQKRNA